ncbi:MAG: hypothetical protein JO353_00495 [Phycisphaerae bacterium]|nr:hypothetical protein [Phycisphaerae bacterium]
MAVFAEDEPTTQPAHATTHPAVIKVEADYGKLSNLTDEQRSKLAEIHKKALADTKEIKAKEESDSRAVLTDDQKAELDKLIAEKKAEASAKNKAHHMAVKGPTTVPAGGD